VLESLLLKKKKRSERQIRWNNKKQNVG